MSCGMCSRELKLLYMYIIFYLKRFKIATLNLLKRMELLAQVTIGMELECYLVIGG